MNLRFAICDLRLNAKRPCERHSAFRIPHSAFTLVELLVTIGIIVILIGILVPVVSRVRDSAREADSKNQISVLSGAIQNYYNAFRAYPGPLSNDEVADTGYTINTVVTPSGSGGPPAGTFDDTDDPSGITMSENLVLGLLGGLRYDSGNLVYDPFFVGQGPVQLGTIPKKSNAFIDATNLSWRDGANGKTGQYQDEAGISANDTIIPEFVDRFSDPLPILYMRARVGTNGIVSVNGDFQYDLEQIFAYTNTNIGTGKRPSKPDYADAAPPPSPVEHGLKTVNSSKVLSPRNLSPSGSPNPAYQFPFDLYPYLTHPTLAGVPRQKDGFVLISAGKDRIYGTKDDIANFGTIGQ